MTTINISLPDEMKDYVSGVVAQRKYGTVSEYVRDLIRRDESSDSELRLSIELMKGFEGPFYEVNESTFGQIIKDIKA